MSDNPRPPIPIYFSHSYRPSDRQLNEFFWELLWPHGFSLTVDPKSDVLSVPYLEQMMKRSACFAAVVAERTDQPIYRTSPFIVFEYGLAVQAQKPLLVFVEQGVRGDVFPDGPGVHPFDRALHWLEGNRDTFETAIKNLAEQSRPYRNLGTRTRRKAGIILPRHRSKSAPYKAVASAIAVVINEHGFAPEEVELNFDANFKWALNLDEYDFVILDVASHALPTWVFPYIYGRFIPTIKLIHLTNDDDATATLSPLLSGQMLPHMATNSEQILFWRDPEELIHKLSAQLKKFDTGRLELHSREEGLRYFRSIGRTSVKVFISNAHDANDFAVELSSALNAQNISYFQYVYHNTIEPGTDWQLGLNERLNESGIFVPLITSAYRESKWCMHELNVARKMRSDGHIKLVPYFLEDVRDVEVETQGRTLTNLPEPEKLQVIVSDLDKILQEAPATPISARSKVDSVDIAVITILPDEFQAVRKHVQRLEVPLLDQGEVNPYGWEIGEVSSLLYEEPFRIVIGLAGRAGNNSGVLVTKTTVERWKPRYVLLVGIAGGLEAGKLKQGDVVVSEVIWGYEYGKIDGQFSPRHNNTFQSDTPIVTSAQTMNIRHPNWTKNILANSPVPNLEPEIKVGPIASGDKLIDDVSNEYFAAVLRAWPKLIAVEMEGAGAATAIQAVREEGLHTVGFAMVRGISDLPRNDENPVMSKGDSIQTIERDAWKKFSADAAACFVVELIRHGWPVAPRSRKT